MVIRWRCASGVPSNTPGGSVGAARSDRSVLLRSARLLGSRRATGIRSDSADGRRSGPGSAGPKASGGIGQIAAARSVAAAAAGANRCRHRSARLGGGGRNLGGRARRVRRCATAAGVGSGGRPDAPRGARPRPRRVASRATLQVAPHRRPTRPRPPSTGGPRRCARAGASGPVRPVGRARPARRPRFDAGSASCSAARRGPHRHRPRPCRSRATAALSSRLSSRFAAGTSEADGADSGRIEHRIERANRPDGGATATRPARPRPRRPPRRRGPGRCRPRRRRGRSPRRRPPTIGGTRGSAGAQRARECAGQPVRPRSPRRRRADRPGGAASGRPPGPGDVAQPSAAVSTASSSTSTLPAAPHQRHSTDSTDSSSTLLVLDGELTTHGVVVVGDGSPGGCDVEAGQVAARRAPVANGRRHGDERIRSVAENTCSRNTCSLRSCHAAQLRRTRYPARRGHVLRAGPRDHRRHRGRWRHHRDRRGQAPRRAAARHLPDLRQPRPLDPAPDHPAHGHLGVDGGRRSPPDAVHAHVPRVPGRRRDRRPQRALRPRLPQRCPRALGAAQAAQPRPRHAAPRPPPGPRRGAQLPPGHARRSLPPPQPPEPSGARRCPGHRRPAAPADRAGRIVRGVRARRPHRAAHDGGPPAGRQAAPHRSAAPQARRLPVPRRRRPHALRRQGHRPPVTGPVVLLQRRPPEGRPAVARDRAHRPRGVPEPARGRGARGPAHPSPRAALQPPVHHLASVLLPQAHRRALPPVVGGAGHP